MVSNMGRHIQEGETKKTVTCSFRPSKWKAFQAVVTEKCPGESASGHLEELMIQETARLIGEEVTRTVNIAALKRQLKALSRERHDIKQILDKTKALHEIAFSSVLKRSIWILRVLEMQVIRVKFSVQFCQ